MYLRDHGIYQLFTPNKTNPICPVCNPSFYLCTFTVLFLSSGDMHFQFAIENILISVFPMAHDSQYYCYSYFIVWAICMLRSITQFLLFFWSSVIIKAYLSIFICTLLLPFVSTTATQWPCHINHLHNGSPYLLIVGHMIIESNTPTQNYVLCGGFSKTNSFGLLPKYYLWIFMAFDGTFFVAIFFKFICCVLCIVWWCCGLELMSLFIIIIGGGGVEIHVWSMLLIFYNSISKT